MSDNEDDSQEEKARKWEKGNAIRILGPREEKEEIQEEQNPCYPWAKGKAIRILGPIEKKEETQEEQINEVESEGTSTMKNSPVTGTVWADARSEGPIEEERKHLKKKKNVSDEANRKLGFGPYGDSAYEEVLTKNPSCVKFTIEGRRKGNAKGRFTHWAMASMVEAYFKLGEVGGRVAAASEMTPEPSAGEGLGKHEGERSRPKAKPYVHPRLGELLEGGVYGKQNAKTRNLQVRRTRLPSEKNSDSRYFREIEKQIILAKISNGRYNWGKRFFRNPTCET